MRSLDSRSRLGSLVVAGVLTVLVAAPAIAGNPQGPKGSVDVQLLGINDFHGNLEPPAGSSGRILTETGNVDAGGVEYLATHVKALEATKGDTSGEALVNAMKGMAWTSPRGPMSIDRETRDVIQNVYVRRVERVDGQLWNVEFQTTSAVKDPGKQK